MNFRTLIVGAAALLGLSSAVARAQETPADPIGGILEQVQEAPSDPEDPEGESAPASPPPSAAYVPPPVDHAPSPPPTTYARPPADYAPVSSPPPAPYAPPYVPPPPRPAVTGPVHIDETSKTPDAPPTPVDRNYEMRLRASSASAQGLQGPLDGAWTLRAGGAELYSLLLVDNGGALEGAWRDPRRRGAVDSSGFLNDIQRTGPGISLNFYTAPGAGLTTITLAPAADGSWTGDIDENGRRREVTLRRH